MSGSDAGSAGPPPRALVHGLLEGPAFLTGFEWHDEIDSTNRRAAELAAEGHPEGYAVAADLQTAGRGRHGRAWTAPAGTSLMVSFLLRPGTSAGGQSPHPHPVVAALPLLPLLVGTALAEVVERHVAGAPVALKWPNDLLVANAKAAGILVEHGAEGAVVAGIGLNVDWRGVERPDELAGATSLAEVAGGPVDRWRVFAGLVGVLGNRYADWRAAPRGFLADYRARCATLGRRVRVERHDRPIEGLAEAVTDGGALVVRLDDGRREEVAAGDVVHLFPA